MSQTVSRPRSSNDASTEAVLEACNSVVGRLAGFSPRRGRGRCDWCTDAADVVDSISPCVVDAGAPVTASADTAGVPNADAASVAVASTNSVLGTAGVGLFGVGKTNAAGPEQPSDRDAVDF